jgi:hypothetical protein
VQHEALAENLDVNWRIVRRMLHVGFTNTGDIELLQEVITKVLEPYWRDPVRLRGLTGFP